MVIRRFPSISCQKSIPVGQKSDATVSIQSVGRSGDGCPCHASPRGPEIQNFCNNILEMRFLKLRSRGCRTNSGRRAATSAWAVFWSKFQDLKARNPNPISKIKVTGPNKAFVSNPPIHSNGISQFPPASQASVALVGGRRRLLRQSLGRRLDGRRLEGRRQSLGLLLLEDRLPRYRLGARLRTSWGNPFH